MSMFNAWYHQTDQRESYLFRKLSFLSFVIRYCCKPLSHPLLLSMMERDLTASTVIKNSVRMHRSGGAHNFPLDEDLTTMLRAAANTTILLLRSKALPKYSSKVNYSHKISAERRQKELSSTCDDCQYSFRASLSGFALSLIDKVPSEVALITVKKVDVMAEWNAHRSTEATGALSVGWMQVDNHCPNAPFPVALSPSQVKKDQKTGCDKEQKRSPFLSVGIVLAPSHKSTITVRFQCNYLTNRLFGSKIFHLHSASRE